METTVCGITAFNYWRIPPIVRLLLLGSDDDPTLQQIISAESLVAFKARALEELNLCRSFFDRSTKGRHIGATSRGLYWAVPLFAANHTGPIDILVSSRSQCHASSLLRPHLWTGDIPSGGRIHLADDIWMASPELILHQFAAQATISQLVMMGDELCGTFAVYNPPAFIRDCLQQILNRRGIPKLAGWEPLVDSRGQLTDLWSRPALASPQTILRFAQMSDTQRGKARLQKASTLIRENAASPFEVRTGILLGFPRRLGGEGFWDFSFNHRVALSREGRLLAQRQFCMCDLFWEKSNLDLECQSALVHQGERGFLSDSDRSAALSYMGISVLPITYAQLHDAQRFAALVKVIGRLLGTRLRTKTDAQAQLSHELRKKVMGNWSNIHRIGNRSGV